MSKKILKVYNYKTLGNKKEVTYEFNNEGINLIIAKNRAGKTSIVQALEEHHGANKFIKNPLTEGEKDGYTEYEGTDKDGRKIKTRWEFNVNGDRIFTAVKQDENGRFKAISDPKKMVELLGKYYPITANEFFQKAKYTEGRKEIIEKYLLMCFTDQQKEELNKLKIAISDKSNTQTKDNLYFKRRDLNRDIDVLTKLINNNNVTEEEQKLLDNENKYRESRDKIVDEIEVGDLAIKGRLLEKTELQKQINMLDAEITAIKIKDAELNERVAKADKVFVRINEIKKKTNKDNEKLELANKTSLLQKTESEINISKEKIKIIYKNSKLPAGLEIGEDEIKLNGFSFDNTTNSESETWLAIIELMCQISDNELIFIGSLSEYDEETRQKVIAITDKYNKFVIATEVESDINEPEIITIIKK